MGKKGSHFFYFSDFFEFSSFLSRSRPIFLASQKKKSSLSIKMIRQNCKKSNMSFYFLFFLLKKEIKRGVAASNLIHFRIFQNKKTQNGLFLYAIGVFMF